MLIAYKLGITYFCKLSAQVDKVSCFQLMLAPTNNMNLNLWLSDEVAVSIRHPHFAFMFLLLRHKSFQPAFYSFRNFTLPLKANCSEKQFAENKVEERELRRGERSTQDQLNCIKKLKKKLMLKKKSNLYNSNEAILGIQYKGFWKFIYFQMGTSSPFKRQNASITLESSVVHLAKLLVFPFHTIILMSSIFGLVFDVFHFIQVNSPSIQYFVLGLLWDTSTVSHISVIWSFR